MVDYLNKLSNSLPRRKFDAVIVGAGGAGGHDAAVHEGERP